MVETIAIGATHRKAGRRGKKGAARNARARVNGSQDKAATPGASLGRIAGRARIVRHAKIAGIPKEAPRNRPHLPLQSRTKSLRPRQSRARDRNLRPPHTKASGGDGGVAGEIGIGILGMQNRVKGWRTQDHCLQSPPRASNLRTRGHLPPQNLRPLFDWTIRWQMANPCSPTASLNRKNSKWKRNRHHPVWR